MDRRSTLLLIVTCLVLVFWYPLMNRIYPPVPLPTNVVAKATGGATGTNASATAPGAASLPVAGAPPVAAARPGIAESGFLPSAEPATEVVLENELGRYVFTSQGGGLKTVELKEHADAFLCRDRKAGAPLPRAVMNRHATAPIMVALGLDGAGEGTPYRMSRSNEVVVAERTLTNGVRLVKEFRLGTNYLVHVTTRLQNWSATAAALPSQEWVFGTAEPLHQGEQSMYLGMFSHDGSSSEHIGEGFFANRTLGCIPGTPKSEYVGQSTNLAWAAVHNQFFATIAIPRDRSTRLFARHVDLPGMVATGSQVPLVGYQAAFLYPAEELPSQQQRVREFDLYVGPKDYKTVAGLGNNADVVMGFDNYFGGRFSGFFARALLLAMNGLHKVGLSYAMAIIAITVIVRLLFWPLMAASARTSKRMAALQPQIKELQERYKDNPQRLNQKMLELWREHKVNPAAGCVPILIQFPILLGFYSMLQTAIELRGESFLWACDLAQPDTIAMVMGYPVNPLPLLMGATMLWQARLTPMSPSMDATQQKIMKYMPLMFMVFLYTFSAGLTLYWTVSNLLSILQMKLTKARDEKTTVAAPSPGRPAAPAPRKPRPPGRSSK
ncbi:MAG: membrane protein insertase YidC [Verrucomicrobiales bacterium]|nr:membrane protein insertase YidC [Verrucomicrobiales bacterium]